MASVGKITALILTYNRKEILARCLHATLAQLEPPDEVLVLDNGSTDGTGEFLQETGLLAHIALYRMPQNVGPAAGIETLFRLAMERGSDWLWFLDDDTIPEPDALKELKLAFTENFRRVEEVGFLRSFVVFPDDKPYDLPPVDMRRQRGKSAAWADRLQAGLVRIRWCQLNSILIPRSTILQVGSVMPIFYFAGEDTEFTLRVTDALPGYLVGRSRATHLKAVSGIFSSVTEPNPDLIGLGRYYYRNNVYLRWRCYSFHRMLLYVAKSLWDAGRALGAKSRPWYRCGTILYGLASGIVFAIRLRRAGVRAARSDDPRPSPVQLSGARSVAL